MPLTNAALLFSAVNLRQLFGFDKNPTFLLSKRGNWQNYYSWLCDQGANRWSMISQVLKPINDASSVLSVFHYIFSHIFQRYFLLHFTQTQYWSRLRTERPKTENTWNYMPDCKTLILHNLICLQHCVQWRQPSATYIVIYNAGILRTPK